MATNTEIIDKKIDEFFSNIPDNVLIQMAIYDMRALKTLCMTLSVSVQLTIEENNKK
jgi:hypothetical protein